MSKTVKRGPKKALKKRKYTKRAKVAKRGGSKKRA